MSNPFPDNYRVYYHNSLKINDNHNDSFFNAFRKEYAKHTHKLTNHVKSETEYQDCCETDNDLTRGVFINF